MNIHQNIKYSLKDYGFKMSDRTTKLGRIYFGLTEVRVNTFNTKTPARVRYESRKLSSSVNEAHSKTEKGQTI